MAMDLKNLSANWKKLQALGTVKSSDKPASPANIKGGPATKSQNYAGLKRKRADRELHVQRRKPARAINSVRKMTDAQQGTEAAAAASGIPSSTAVEAANESTTHRINEGLARNVEVARYLALDCEMVGIGAHPHLESALARVSMVNYNGEQVYDSYVKPQEEVTDWRTHVSGIRPEHMLHARSLEQVQTDVAALIKGRIVVGHSIRGDFKALFLDHPERDIRDTARHQPYRNMAGGGSPKLKILASELLGLDIQTGEHSSVEDARATMLLFKRDKDAFEKAHIKKWGPAVVVKKVESKASGGDAPKKPKKKKKKKR